MSGALFHVDRLGPVRRVRPASPAERAWLRRSVALRLCGFADPSRTAVRAALGQASARRSTAAALRAVRAAGASRFLVGLVEGSLASGVLLWRALPALLPKPEVPEGVR